MTIDTAAPAVACALAGIRAVDPTAVTAQAVRDLRLSGPVALVAMGKASLAMARGACEALGDAVEQGVVVAPVPGDRPAPGVQVYTGGHPIPNEDGVRAAEAVERLATSLSAAHTLVCLISGGASALTMAPADGLSLADVQQLTQQLLRAGATIHELNCVRKHVDRLKGGRLARLAMPARLAALVLSDVVGDSLDVIASGPTVPDPTTVADAVGILQRRGVWETIPAAIRDVLSGDGAESPKPGDACFARATSRVIANNARAAEAARAHAETLGYTAEVLTTTLAGEARDVAPDLIRDARRVQQETESPRCMIYAGETTVTVTGDGRGGRNQELALAAAIALDGVPGITLASVGTDGIDGPTDAAGAVASGDTVAHARAMGLDARDALTRNDAYPFWKTVGGLVMTGPTGTNVMDLVIVTIEPRR